MKIDKNIYALLKSLENVANGKNDRTIDNDDLNITEKEWYSLIDLLQNEDLIKGYKKTKYVDEPSYIYLDINPEITYKGIEYLKENSTSSKALKIAKELKDFIPFLF